MNTPKHSPLPFVIRGGNVLVSKAGEQIAEFIDWYGVDQRIQEANREFIPRACNSHEELLAQLQRLVRYYEPSETRPEALGKLSAARAAIAKAEGGQP